MALFKRNAKPEPKQEQRSLEQDYGYSYPLSLSLVKGRVAGQATSLSTVFAALELISNSLASIPIHIRENETGEIIAHPIDRALNNGLITRFNLIKSMVWDMLLYGDGISYIERAGDGTPNSIIYCPHGTYTIEYNEQSRKLFYLIPSIKRGRIEPINILHFIKNSANGVQGRGLLYYAASTIKSSKSAEDSASDFYDSGCNLNGLLKSSRPLTEQQKMDIRTTWSQTMQNSGNGIAVLGADLDYQSVGINASDAQLLETRQFNVTEIARFFNVSPQLLGDLSHTQYGSVEQAQLALISNTLMPLIVMIQEEMTRKLFKPSEFNLTIDLDETHILLADKAATANYFSTLVQNGILTTNEARHTLGYAPIEGGDVARVAFSDINQNTIGNTDTQEETDETE